MTWAGISPWLTLASALAAMAIGGRWAFQPERVVANPRSGASDPRTVRVFGYFLLAIGAAISVATLFKFLSE